jgi:hypothetical protein
MRKVGETFFGLSLLCILHYPLCIAPLRLFRYESFAKIECWRIH